MGDHLHINNGTHRLQHFWPLIFTPYIRQKPLFLPQIVTQSPVFFKLSRILQIFHSKTPNRLEFEKKLPKCLLLSWLLLLKGPYFCLACTCLRGMLILKHSQKLENFNFSWNRIGHSRIVNNRSCNLVNTFRYANLMKVMKTKFQFYKLNRPDCALWINFIGGQGWYKSHHPPGQTGNGIYPKTILYRSEILTSRNKW